MTDLPEVSIIVPLFNEQDNVAELANGLTQAMGDAGVSYEVIFIDDGSTDRTYELLAEAAAVDPRVMVVSLSRNFGHQAALSAALDYVSGDVVIAMDGDLQDPPELLSDMRATMAEQGADVVYAVYEVVVVVFVVHAVGPFVDQKTPVVLVEPVVLVMEGPCVVSTIQRPKKLRLAVRSSREKSGRINRVI